MKTRILRDHEFPAAGRVWVVPELHLVSLPDGTEGVSVTEFDRIHRAIAAAICGTPGPLSPDEFEFLCDVADVPYAQVADLLDLDRSALTKWMHRKTPWKSGRSNSVKLWFLLKLFGDVLGRHPLRAEDLEEPGDILPTLRDEVIRRGVVESIAERGQLLHRPAPRYRPPSTSGAIRAANLPEAVALARRLPRRRRREARAR